MDTGGMLAEQRSCFWDCVYFGGMAAEHLASDAKQHLKDVANYPLETKLGTSWEGRAYVTEDLKLRFWHLLGCWRIATALEEQYQSRHLKNSSASVR